MAVWPSYRLTLMALNLLGHHRVEPTTNIVASRLRRSRTRSRQGGRGQDLGEEGRGREADPRDEGGEPRVSCDLAAGGVETISRR